MKKNYRICSRCVMDTSDVDIVFDEQGYCNHCNNYFKKIKERTYKGNESDILLQKITDRMKAKSRNRNYDCILGVSGGIDSSYAAYILKKMGMRTLLVHVDNGWNSEISVSNIKSLAEKLDFDYDCYVLDWNDFRDLQLSFLRASVPEIETPTDIALPGALHKIAMKYHVKYIISGGNFVTEGILPKTWHYNAKDYLYLKHIHKTFGTGKLKNLPKFGWLQESFYKIFSGIRFVYILNYVDYQKDTAKELLENQLNWKYYGGKHYESIYTGVVQSYILPVKFDIDYRRATLSTQICAGEISRGEALRILTTASFDLSKVNNEIQYICKKFDITLKEFDNIMKSEPKIYRDYPNAEKKLELIYKVYRFLFRKPDYR